LQRLTLDLIHSMEVSVQDDQEESPESINVREAYPEALYDDIRPIDHDGPPTTLNFLVRACYQEHRT